MNPSYGLIIVGDEILSGKRSDKHMPKVIELLSARGLSLDYADYVGDNPDRITATLERAFASGDVVFSCGGIGATPDDHTRQCAARALGRGLALHPEAESLIRERMQDVAREQGVAYEPDRPDNVHRLNMGMFPEGAQIIPNPYNKIPGFSCQGSGGGSVHFLPGFPVMAWPMVEWVLDSKYAHLHHAEDYVERALTVWDTYEGQLIDLMREVSDDFPEATLFSLPTLAEEGRRRSLELGMKGPAERVAAAMARIRATLSARGLEWQDKA